MSKKRTANRKYFTLGTVAIVFLLWFIATNFTNIPAVVLPSPQSVFQAFVDVSTHGYGVNKDTLLVHLASSLARLLVAFALTVVTAIPLGLLSGYFTKVHAVVNPLIEFYRPIPPLAYYTLLVLWFGINEESKVILLYLAGLAPLYIACVAGVRRIKEEKLQGAFMLGANTRQVFFHVVVPSVLPDMFTGMRTALGMIYTTLVAAEMVAAKTGIGWMVLDASNWLKSDVVFFGVILMGMTGVALNYLLVLLERMCVHWSGKE